MSFEAIDSITKAEQAARDKVTGAGVTARNMVNQSRETGEIQVAAAKTQAAEERRILLEKTNEEIRLNASAAGSKAASAAEALRAEAAEHMTEAVNLIIERIVKA